MFDFIRRDTKPSKRRNPNAAAERDLAQAALARAAMRKDRAAEQRALTELQELEPSEPRWAHKLGDVLRRVGQEREAAVAYRRASELYSELGFAQRALAMKRLARSFSERSGHLLPSHPSLRPDLAMTPPVPPFELSFVGRRVP